MPAADRDPDGRIELTYQQAAQLYARAEERAALLRAAAAPAPPPTRPRRSRRWRAAFPAAAVAVAVGVAMWANDGTRQPAGPSSLDAFTMGPTIARPQASVGESGPVSALAPTLGFQVLLPHSPLANPRLLAGAWAGRIATGDDSGPAMLGIVLEFPSTGLRIVELPVPPSRVIGIPSGLPRSRLPGRSAVVDGLLVRVVALSGHHTQAEFDAVLRSLG